MGVHMLLMVEEELPRASAIATLLLDHVRHRLMEVVSEIAIANAALRLA